MNKQFILFLLAFAIVFTITMLFRNYTFRTEGRKCDSSMDTPGIFGIQHIPFNGGCRLEYNVLNLKNGSIEKRTKNIYF